MSLMVEQWGCWEITRGVGDRKERQKKERKPETQGDRTNEELVQFKVKGRDTLNERKVGRKYTPIDPNLSWGSMWVLWDSTNSLAQTQPWHYQKAFAVWQTLIMHRKYDETPMRWGLSCLSQTYKRGNRVTRVIKPLPNVTDGRRQILGQGLG